MVYAKKPLQFSLVTCPFTSPGLGVTSIAGSPNLQSFSPKSPSLSLECNGPGMGGGGRLLVPSVFPFQLLELFLKNYLFLCLKYFFRCFGVLKNYFFFKKSCCPFLS